MTNFNVGLKEIEAIANLKPKMPPFTPEIAEEEVKNLIHILNIGKDDSALLFQELNHYGVYCQNRSEVIERIEFFAQMIPLYVISEIEQHYPQLAKEVNLHE